MSHSHAPETAVIAATTTTAIANWFDLISDGIGLVALLLTITLTIILIKKHLTELRVLEEDERRKKERRK